MRDWDIIVIGGGISGLSLASTLAAESGTGAGVLVCEQESQPGYHASGRSAAVLLEPYINPAGCALTRFARPFFEAPPVGFGVLSHPVESFHVTDEFGADAVDAFLSDWRELCPRVREVDPARVVERCPIAERGRIHRAIEDPTALHLDVHALLEGHRRRFLELGGTLHTGVEIRAGQRANGVWHLRTAGDTLRAAVVVNAAGAWCDTIATQLGVAPIGLQPLRRTAILVDVDAPDVADWALVHRLNDELYFKPEGRALMASLMDETPSAPCDARPEELDVAILMDRLQTETTLAPRRPSAQWAGLRTFAGDRLPAIGFDADAPGFFWYAGQGGFGIQLSPTLGAIGAALLNESELPAGIAVGADAVAPGRAGVAWRQDGSGQPHSE